MRHRSLLALVLLAFAIVPRLAFAAIIGFTGEGTIMTPSAPGQADLTPDFFNDLPGNVTIRAWNEVQNFTLGTDILVDITQPGTYSGAGFVSEDATIATGSVISSHVFFQDPDSATRSVATFEFDTPVIGIIVLSDLPSGDRFLMTDFLRNAFSTTPGVHVVDRGLEFAPEFVTLSLDRRFLTLDVTSGSPGDQVRVITQGAVTTVPEPSTMLLLATGLVAIGRRLRSRTRENHQ
jgi:hypothetical protein